MLTRIAPTPSGYLHLGNLVNLQLVNLVAGDCGARVLLRIDDLDTGRVRPRYVDDVFAALEWLEISWEIGPRNAVDLHVWSQAERMPWYRSARDALVERGAVFACRCSRTQWHGYGGLSCPSDCQRRGVRHQVGLTSLHLDEPGHREVVVWRRDDLPAYHLASIVDDAYFGVDLVVRGEDLADATNVQKLISSALPDDPWAHVVTLHHPLITDELGRKLSKSAGRLAAPFARSTASLERVRDIARDLFTAMRVSLPRSPGS